MSRIPGRRPEDARLIQAAWINAPALTLIDGPYSLMLWDRTAKDPDDPGREYHWDHFDLVRAENGMIKEDWDEAVINAPQPTRPSPRAPAHAPQPTRGN